MKAVERGLADGGIVAMSTGVGRRIVREEMVAAAMRVWPQDLIEEALGADAAGVMPEAVRLVELRARIPRYQRDMLRVLARRNETTVDDVLARELEDVACAHADELSAALPELNAELAWPSPAYDR